MMGKSLGLFILFGSVIGSMIVKSNIGPFIDLSTFQIVGIPLLILFFVGVIKKKGSLNDIPQGKDLSHWEIIGSTSLYLGILGAFVGFIIMFKKIDDPSSIGPAMAIALLSMIYSLIGFLTSFFLGNFKARPSYYYIPFLQMFFLISVFYILALSFK